jgi:hypothetical protein
MPRPEYRDKDFVGKRILLDGIDFFSCTFTSCKLVYKGGASFPPRNSKCSLARFACSARVPEAEGSRPGLGRSKCSASICSAR